MADAWAAFAPVDTKPADPWAGFTPVAAPTNDNSASDTIDASTGAPAAVRAVVGSVPDADRLQAIKKFYPDAKPAGDDNFVYTDPKTGTKKLYNPSGLDMGDLASLVPEAAQMVGGTVGAALGGAGGTAVAPGVGTVAGAVGGAGVGASIANEAVQRTAMALSGVTDQRSAGQQIKDAAATTALNSVGEGVGVGAAAGVKAAIKGLARGGAAGRVATGQAIDDLQRFGVTPSAAQATPNASLDTVESFVGKMPGGAGVIRQAAQKQSDAVAAAVATRVAAMTKSTAAPEAFRAGNAVQAGVQGFVKDFGDKADALYGKLDGYIPSDTPVQVSNTAQVLSDVAEPTAGAENFSRSNINPKLSTMLSGLTADIQNNGGSLPYSALAAERSRIGRALGSPTLLSDIPRAQLKQVYGGLTADMRGAAQDQGDAALKAFDRANNYYKAGTTRIDTMLDPLVQNKIPEQAFAAVESSAKLGPSRIMALRKSVTPDQWNAVAGTVVDRLGKAQIGQQGTGDVANFSFQKFLTNWQSLPPSSKSALFSGPNMGSIRTDLDALARASDRIRVSSQAFANNSGTGGVNMGNNMILGAIGGALSGSARLLGTVATAGTGGYAGAKLLTNPNFVRWLAQSTKITPNGISAHMARLGAIAANSDPDTRDAITGLLGQLQNTPDQPDQSQGATP